MSSPTCCCQLRAPLRRHQVGHHHHDHFSGNYWTLLVEKCELLLSRLPVSLPFLRDSRRRGRREELDWRRHTTIFNSTNSLLSTKVHIFHKVPVGCKIFSSAFLKNYYCSFPFRCQTLWAHCVTTSKLARMSR